jgi:subtilisin family serine protease
MPAYAARLGGFSPDAATSGVVRSEARPSAYLIELTQPAAVLSYAGALGDQSPTARASAVAAATLQVARNKAQQDALVAALPSAAPGARIIYQVSRAMNGVAVRVPASEVAALSKLPGVKAVHAIYPSYKTNAYSVPFIGAPTAWAGAGGIASPFKGENIKIGIIDTGIDYLHAGFGSTDSSLTAYQNEAAATANFTMLGTTYPTAKVVGGYDFVGDAYNADLAPPPIPDPNPMDCNGHGSHVAGTAAGTGVNADGSTYTGPYDASAPFSSLRIGPGVAPKAKLYALRVFGCAGSTDVTVAAIDWAIDPNGDGDFADHLDVINMSLGSPYGRLSDPSSIASDNASLAGVITVASAGNSGDSYTVSGSPGSAERAITVANASSFRQGVALNVNAPAAIAGIKTSVLAAWSADQVWPLGPTFDTIKFSDGDLACTPYPAGFFAGRAALVNRGTCGFAVKYDNAVAAGATLVIVAQNSAAAPITMGGVPAGPTTVPAIMISQADGNAIKTQLNLPAAVTVSLALGVQTLGDGLSASSSRGPTGEGSVIVAKPDLTAPGTNIVSVQTGHTCTTTGCQRPDPSAYVPGSQKLTLSGTSMAAPHIAGVMALLRQAHPTYSIEQLKALAVNGSLHNVFVGDGGTGLRFGPALAGAGRVDIVNTLTSQVAAFAGDDPGAVSVTFDGEIVGTVTQARRVTVRNFGTTPQTYDLGIDLVTDATGVSLSVPAQVTVPAGSSAAFNVQMNANAAAMKRSRDATAPAVVGGLPRQWLTEESGVITLSQGGTLKLRVPVYAAVHPAAHTTASALLPAGPAGAASIVLGGTGVCTGSLSGPTCTATSSDFVSLVTPVELQGVNPINPALNPRSNLRYAGVVFDAVNQVLKFGVATWGDRTSFRDTEFDVYIDTNGDGTDDWVLFSATLTGAPDTPVSYVLPLPSGAGSTQDFLNFIGSNTADTAVYLNNLAVLPLYPADIGMSATAPTFRYKVAACDNHTGVCETIGPFTYTGAGFTVPDGPLPGLPGTIYPVTVNPAVVAANGSLGVLLLHHHNVEGERAAVSTLTPSPTSTSVQTSSASVVAGTTVTLTATVNGVSPSGTVAFSNGPQVVAGCNAVALTGSGNTRTAQCTTAPLTMGTYTFTAAYNGDAFNSPSSGTVAQAVTAVSGQACRGFSDVDSSDPLCASLDWIANRQITLGCSAGMYCPNLVVNRLALAAFMNRLGTGMTPQGVAVEAASGAIVLNSGPVVCSTAGIAVSDFPRRVYLKSVFTATAGSTVDIAADPVVSFDGGATWQMVANTASQGVVHGGHWGNLGSVTSQDLNVGQTARFGLRVSRGGASGSADLTDSRCNLRALVSNRNSTFAPFDAAK